jgi:hypothetical protein
VEKFAMLESTTFRVWFGAILLMCASCCEEGLSAQEKPHSIAPADYLSVSETFSLGPALVANSLRPRAGEAYDEEARELNLNFWLARARRHGTKWKVRDHGIIKV